MEKPNLNELKKYDYIASRSETILKDVLRYLKIPID